MDQKLFNRYKEKVQGLSGEVFYAADSRNAGEMVAQIVRKMGSITVGVVTSPLVEECHVMDNVQNTGAVVYDSGLSEHAAEIKVGISEMDLAVAGTGTLAQDATNLEMRLVSMLSDVHIALVRGANIVPDIGNALNYFYRKGKPPGYIAFVSGPSRTADIERVLTIGVHGPGRLIVIVVDQAGEGK